MEHSYNVITTTKFDVPNLYRTERISERSDIGKSKGVDEV